MWQAATWALRSPIISRGMRTLARMTSKRASTGSPSVVEPQPRQPQPLLEHLGAVAGARARDAPAEVAVVGDRDREAEQLLACEGRLDDEDVRRVARAVERVVDDVDVAGRGSGRRSARTGSPSRSGSSRAGAGSSPPARPSRPSGRRARPRSPWRRGRPPSARCGRSSSPSRRQPSRARWRRAAARSDRLAPASSPGARPRRARARAPASRASTRPSSPAARRRSCRTRRSAAGRRPARLRATRGCAPATSIVPWPAPKLAARRPPSAGPLAARAARQRQLRPRRAERDQAERPDVDRRAGLEPRAVEPLVLGLEALDERGQGRVVDRAREVDRDAPVLAAVADVGEALPLGLDAGPERRGESSRISSSSRSQLVEVRLARARPGRSGRRGTRRARTAARRPRRGRRAAARSRS